MIRLTSVNAKSACTYVGNDLCLRLASRFFRAGASGIAMGNSSCIQIPFIMSPSRWFISYGCVRLRTWAAIADEQTQSECFKTVNAWADRPRFLDVTIPMIPVFGTYAKRSEQREALGVYFLKSRLTRYGAMHHCPTQTLGGQGETFPLVG